jgi:hypothetical protein
MLPVSRRATTSIYRSCDGIWLYHKELYQKHSYYQCLIYKIDVTCIIFPCIFRLLINF